MSKGLGHYSNSREGKVPLTHSDPGHSGKAKGSGMKAISHQRHRRKTAYLLRQTAENWQTQGQVPKRGIT